jgi:hypothetical protein
MMNRIVPRPGMRREIGKQLRKLKVQRGNHKHLKTSMRIPNKGDL